MRLLFLSVVLFSCSISLYGAPSQNNLDMQSKALSIINNFASSICNKIPLEGSNQSIRINASGKISIGKLIKKLGDLDSSLKGIYEKNNYKGVLQKELPSLLIKTENCKSDIAKSLIKKMIPREITIYKIKDKKNIKNKKKVSIKNKNTKKKVTKQSKMNVLNIHGNNNTLESVTIGEKTTIINGNVSTNSISF